MDAASGGNAFSIMKSSAKRKRPNTGGQEVGQPSSFRSCPLCEAAIPRALIQDHAARCNGTAAKPSVTETNTGSRTRVQSLSLTPEAVPNQLHSEASQTTYTSQPQPAPSTSNAFSYLMSEQRDRSQVLIFFLEHLPDNSWQAHWWPKGSKASTSDQVDVQTQASNATPNAAQPAPTAPGCQAVWSATTQMSSSILQDFSTAATSSSKAKVTVQLQTNVAPGVEGDLSQLTASATGASMFKGSPSLLKSALQKNIRLCRAAPAVRCALQLMKDNVADFLRRVSIICLEDALLHPDMPLLLWLMCAQAKGYILGTVTGSACLQIVHELASVTLRDSYPAKDPPALHSETSPSPRIAAQEGLLVRCILIRAAYGGMAGDVAMLKAFASTWNRRFQDVHSCPCLLPAAACTEGPNANRLQSTASDSRQTWLMYLQQTYRSLTVAPGGVAAIAMIPLRRGDIPLSAVDFHISSIVEELMQTPGILTAAHAVAAKQGDSDAHDSLRRAMWLFRSGINLKKALNVGSTDSIEKGNLLPLWQASYVAADAWSADYIRRRFI